MVDEDAIDADSSIVQYEEDENPMTQNQIEESNVEANTIQTPVTRSTPTLFPEGETPGGTIYCEPYVETQYLPFVRQTFDTIEQGVNFYNTYAEKAGFEAKMTCQKKTKSGLVKSKYVMCNREGNPKEININTLDPQHNDKQVRNTRHRLTGCRARIKIALDDRTGKYEVVTFDPKHNHRMIPKEFEHLTKKQRKMTQTEKMFVIKASTMKLGGTKAHHLYSTMKGGSQYVHGTTDDFKNHIRDVNEVIGESDAHMLIEKMENRKLFAPDFTFQYKVENGVLVVLFWADEVDKCNYNEFGDVISFDATFRTNKYDMVFVPFTAIDNHRKSVTVGAGLLLCEDTEAYIWLLTSFLTAHTKQPDMVVTDQDGAMKRAIEAVFTQSKHRLCMWHIMQKVPSKICKETYEETNFKERFNKLVWNMFIEPKDFEERWNKLIEDFKLQDHKWMKKMFTLREMWLPAYFITSPLFGLMRNTSRSESENAFFKCFTNHGSTLLNFMMCYEAAIERQRHRQEFLDFKTFEAASKPYTRLEMETHAAKIYTRTIFLLVQKEIMESIWACQIVELRTEEGVETAHVKDTRAGEYRTIYTEEGKEMVIQEEDKVATYKVLRHPEDGSVSCTCRHFTRYGFLCRHVFCVLKNRDVGKIPDKYILRRWRRDLIPLGLRRKTNRYGEKNETIERLTNNANNVVDECLFWLSKDEAKLAEFVQTLEKIKKEIQVQVPKPPSQKTSDVILDLYAIGKPAADKPIIGNPEGARNKAGLKGERKAAPKGARIKSAREMAIKAKKKQARKCLCCKQVTNEHTKNTCPLNPKYIAKLALMKAAQEEARNVAATEAGNVAATKAGNVAATEQTSNTAC